MRAGLRCKRGTDCGEDEAVDLPFWRRHHLDNATLHAIAVNRCDELLEVAELGHCLVYPLLAAFSHYCPIVFCCARLHHHLHRLARTGLNTGILPPFSPSQ